MLASLGSRPSRPRAAASPRPSAGWTGRWRATRPRARCPLVAAVALPVSADLENGFADDPQGVAATVGSRGRSRARRVLDRGLHGPGRQPSTTAGRERVAAAAEAATGTAAAGADRARREPAARQDDLADTVARLQASPRRAPTSSTRPGWHPARHRDRGGSVDRPVNVLAMPGARPWRSSPNSASPGSRSVARLPRRDRCAGRGGPRAARRRGPHLLGRHGRGRAARPQGLRWTVVRSARARHDQATR